MPYWPTRIIVEEVEGTCPYFKKGDTFYTERSGIIPDASTGETGLCMFAISRMSVLLNLFTRGMKQHEKGVECGSPGLEHGGCSDGGGIVRFRIVPGRKKEILYATKESWEKAKKDNTLQWKEKEFQQRDPEEKEVGVDWISKKKG